MEMVICDTCRASQASSCCICRFPISSYCDGCFNHHITAKTSAFHYQLPISARSIDSRDKQKALIMALMELYEYSENAADASIKFENAKEKVGAFINAFFALANCRI